jgi:methanogenic corrinoid protein MtbC1
MERAVQQNWAQGGAQEQPLVSERSGHWQPVDLRGAADAMGPPTAEGTAEQRLLRLAQAIEHDIIPRLMLVHRANDPCPVVPVIQGGQIGRAEVERFARLVLAGDDDLPLACVEELRARGVMVEAIYLDLLAPTARYLGDLWTEDLCDFTDVTVGLGRLQRVLRELSPALAREGEVPEHGLRILLLPSPGEQHTFGLVMVGEFFRRAGWQVAGGPWETALEAPVMVAAERYDAVGFSLGAEVHLEALRDCIAAVRRASRNRGVAIIVGGPIFQQHPEFARSIGADEVSRDGREAPAQAAQLIKRMTTPG